MREQFSKFGFLLATIGGAIGIANLIAFPAYLKEFGILYLFIYLAFTILIGVPLMNMEIAIGRASASNAPKAYSQLSGKKRWSNLGFINIGCCFFLFTIFIIVFVWTFRYLIGFTFNMQPPDLNAYCANNYGEVILIGGILIAANALIVGMGVEKGIEKASRIFVPIFLLITIFFAFANFREPEKVLNSFNSVVHLPRADEWKKLLTCALGQAFFSLSLGAGAMLTYGSYLSKKENINGLSNVIVQADSIVAILCALFILPLNFIQLNANDPATIYVTITDYFNHLAYGRILGVIFYSGLSFVVLTMTVSVLEPIVSFFYERGVLSRIKSSLLVGLLSFLLIIPMSLSFGGSERLTKLITIGSETKSLFFLSFDIFINILLPVGGLLTCLFIRQVWRKAFFDELNLNPGAYKQYMLICVKYVTPLLIAVLLVVKIVQFFGW